MKDPRERFFGMYEAMARTLGRQAAWTLVQLLRTGNGHPPLSGPDVTAADVLHLYVVLQRRFGHDPAWYLVDTLREMNAAHLRDGTDWPDSFARRKASR